MDENYEELQVEFTWLPGIDLRLWTAIQVAVLAVTGLAVAVAAMTS